MPRLKYIGKDPHTEYLPGVPASDHTESSEKRARELVESGLYRRLKPKARAEDAPSDAEEEFEEDEEPTGESEFDAAPERTPLPNGEVLPELED